MRAPLQELHDGQPHHDREREEQRPRHPAEQDEDQHAVIVWRSDPGCHASHAGASDVRVQENRRVSTKDIIFTLGVMLVAGLVCQLLADTIRGPRMLVLLLGGTLLGPSVADVIDVPLDSTGAELLLTLGVSFILFFGGLQLSVGVLSRVGVGIGLLAVPGVVVTALVTGTVAAVAFDLPLSTGLLIGAVVAPTDPAILIPLFDRIGIRQKIEQTAIAESALNDATGAVLALVLAGVVESGDSSLAEPVLDFLTDLAISTVLGIAFGVVLSLVVSDRRAGVWKESAAIAVVAVVAVGYFSTDSAGGSGYLGAFLAGLIVGNMARFRLGMHTEHERDMRSLVGTITEVVVILVFITLGANLPWSDIWDNLAPALVVVVIGLILLARPLTVLLCLGVDRRGRWTREEMVFLGWTRETGVVAAALAGLMVARDIPNAELIVTTVAVAIVVTLALQTTTKVWLGRRLGLEEKD